MIPNVETTIFFHKRLLDFSVYMERKKLSNLSKRCSLPLKIKHRANILKKGS